MKARAFHLPWPELLFRQGFGTRHECLGLLAAGRVRHGGRTVGPLDPPISTDELVFEVDGTDWPWREPAIVLLNKPAGTECSQQPREHASVMSLLPAPLRRRGVQPVGRLDVDTTGLLVLTDDGPLIHRLTHPRRHVSKVYIASTRHPVDEAAAARLLAGVVLHDDPRPVRATDCALVDAHTLRLTITDGRYHQVRRMVAAVGNRCEALHRVSFGPWALPAELPAGQWCWVQSPA